MARELKIANTWIGDGHPVYIVAEIGANHNGSIEIATQLIDVAVRAGCDAVKFQKRTPELCVPTDQRDIMRETPWGYIPYLEYREKLEFGVEEYQQIDTYCREKKITWFASCWDEGAMDFIGQFDPACYKISSACITDRALLQRAYETAQPVMLSTGMSTMAQIEAAVEIFKGGNLIINHCTSAYPCAPAELNLRMIETLRCRFTNPIGYSGHEAGLVTTVAAVVLGAAVVERHITLDRAMWGSDQAASVEPGGFERLVKYIRVTEAALGDGVKRIYAGEREQMKRLRRVGG
jgi:N-acetylneuraminate synthase